MDLQNPRTPRFSTEFLNELRSRTSLELVAADYLDLKPAGVGRVKALCPVHAERTPSFTINIDWGRFHCFGCGASGDAIDFLMQVDGLRFVESVSELANRAGLAVPQGSDSLADNDLRARNELRSVLEKAQQLTSEWLLTLPEGRAARDFLRARGFTSEHAQEWGLGYNPVGGNALSAALTAAGHPLEIQRDAGITKEGERGYYDAFRGRLMWPIHDPQGRIVGFTGRDLTGTAPAKYLNTSATDLFHKGDLLFGYDKARRSMLQRRQVFVVEGQTDVMAMVASGLDNTVAASGSAFSRTQAELLASRVGDGGEIIVGFDNDTAGRKAAWALFQACQGFTTNITVLDFTAYGDKSDPCDVRTVGGADALVAATDKRRPALRTLLTGDIGNFDLTTPEGKVNATEQVRRRLSAVQSAVLRREYQQWAATEIGVDTGDVSPTQSGASQSPATDAAPLDQPLTDADCSLAAYFIAYPQTAETVLAQLKTDLYQLFSRPVAEIVEMSTVMYPHGRPVSGDAAELWSQVMTEAVEHKHHRLLWLIAFTEVMDAASAVDTASRVQRRTLLHAQTQLQQRLTAGGDDEAEILQELMRVNQLLRRRV
ncbi:DNA primase [Rhodococcus sp. NJ-530]|uniref:DNA primase n=1 Tax=Rhodococcus sp. NJ-530 TaxID=2490853 RepID=UPI000F61B1EA|nr:DNA primase [Rhodococcus sp. NJ-530]AZI65538.1 DNA primase [Rhodococcus sp. NJ-530]